MTILSTFKIKRAAWVGAVLLLTSAAIAPAEALTVAPPSSGVTASTGLESVAYLRRVYRDRYGRMRRAPRSRVNSPNYFCRSQPSRCR